MTEEKYQGCRNHATFIRNFPLRFEQQGYYLTASRERIDSHDVELEIEEVELDG